jgi:hypothetical protein
MSSDVDDGAFRVGVAMAHHADWDTGENVYPGNGRIGRTVGKSRPKTNEAVKRLERAGWLWWTGRYGPSGTKNYTLTIPEGVTAAEHPGVTAAEHPTMPECPLGVTAAEHLGVTAASHNLLTTLGSEEDKGTTGRLAPPASPTATDYEWTDRIVGKVKDRREPKWRDATIDGTRIAPVVATLRAAAWEEHLLTAHALMAGPPKDATALLTAHLRRLIGTDPEAWRATEWPRLPYSARFAAAGVVDLGDLVDVVDGEDPDDPDDLDAHVLDATGHPTTAAGVAEGLRSLRADEAAGGDPLGDYARRMAVLLIDDRRTA